MGWVFFSASGTAPVAAQILHGTEPLPSFEVATIKPANGFPASSGTSPSEARIVDTTARNLIEQAYGIPWTAAANERVLGGPGWIDMNRYDVDGRIEESLAATLQKMSRDGKKVQVSLMLQSLLADRFKLKIHFEWRELSVYALVVAKSGLKLTPAKAPVSGDDSNAMPSPNVILLYGHRIWGGDCLSYIPGRVPG